MATTQGEKTFIWQQRNHSLAENNKFEELIKRRVIFLRLGGDDKNLGKAFAWGYLLENVIFQYP